MIQFCQTIFQLRLKPPPTEVMMCHAFSWQNFLSVSKIYLLGFAKVFCRGDSQKLNGGFAVLIKIFFFVAQHAWNVKRAAGWRKESVFSIR